ncbi:hypothetical protein FisN_22Hu260 [Fistulifera solaris]|uniref:Uncharacterized protein n=1 Tax=Fistulifera solaris TaxID=1519565 RepID=A0A1Z5JFY3_FISSO|nr:hypothetical protein FisN_22Hu260 [Fistulifera solaris]|eukprot:GAX12927.1 hypothetical protein FisN_22Hu260 [Fistulifera solaris]
MRTRRKSTAACILLVSLLIIACCDGASASYPTNGDPYHPSDDYNARWQNDSPEGRSNRPPPPPPPPSQQSASAFTARTPIHYNFRSKASGPEVRLEEDGNLGAFGEYSESKEGKVPEYASARRDPVTLFQSTFRGRLLLFASAFSTGALLSAFLLHGWWHPGALAFTIGYLLRGAFGDCVRSLALAMLWTMQRSRRVWKEYPTWRHVKACLRAGPRRPYPPTSNPWNYQPSPNASSFNMMYTLISIAIVGSTVGGNVPLVPKWLGGLLGAGFFAYLATQPSALGDLVRTAGMRVVGLLQELWEVTMELRLRQQLTVFAVRLFDRLMFLDRQHRIRDRVTAGVTLFYQQVIVRAMNQQNGSTTEDDEPRSDRSRRRRPAADENMDRFDRGSRSYRERFPSGRKGEPWQDGDRGTGRGRRDRGGIGRADDFSNDREREWKGQQGRRATDNSPDQQRSRIRRTEWQTDGFEERRGPDFQDSQAEDEPIYYQ